MAHVKRGVTQRNRHKKITKRAKGYYGRRKNCIRTAKQAVDKALQYGYRDRRNKKRDFRRIWVQRINAAVRTYGLRYSDFIHGVQLAGIEMDRKVLAHLAAQEPEAFKVIVDKAQSALAGKKAA